MSVEEKTIEYKISNHAKTRYAERIMGKEDDTDINRFIINNEDKIRNDINKMIRYGEVIYTGRQSQKDGKGNVIDVYLKDCWVILVDSKSINVVTLFKIDLGLDDEFNHTYITKMLEKLNENKRVLDETKLQVQNESDMYRQLLDETTAQIREYKSMINNLEELCSGYRLILDNNSVKLTQANRDVAEVVNVMIGKKEF